jgi:ATP-dependent Lon protease
MDHLDQLGAKAFAGFLVRKDLVSKYSRQYLIPTYVVEFLMGRYCASTDPAEIAEAAPRANGAHWRGGAVQGPLL